MRQPYLMPPTNTNPGSAWPAYLVCFLVPSCHIEHKSYQLFRQWLGRAKISCALCVLHGTFIRPLFAWILFWGPRAGTIKVQSKLETCPLSAASWIAFLCGLPCGFTAGCLLIMDPAPGALVRQDHGLGRGRHGTQNRWAVRKREAEMGAGWGEKSSDSIEVIQHGWFPNMSWGVGTMVVTWMRKPR